MRHDRFAVLRRVPIGLLISAAASIAQADSPPPPGPIVAGEWFYEQPQTFAPNGVLELVFSEGPCVRCYPILVFRDTVAFAGTLKITLPSQFLPYGGQSFTLFSYQHSLPTGQFSSFDLPTLPEGVNWNTDSLYNSGQLAIHQPVPEPAGTALWLLGLATLGAVVKGRTRPSSAGV